MKLVILYGIVLPKEALKVEEGAAVYLTEAPNNTLNINPKSPGFDGGDSLRDESALEISLNRPLQHFIYGKPPPSIFELAAIYCSGLVKSHPFIDGNKRTGFMTAYTF